MRRLIFFSLTFIFIFFSGFLINTKALEYQCDTTNQAEALLITYSRSDNYNQNNLISLAEYDIQFTNHDVTILDRGTKIYNFSYTKDFLTLYLQFTNQRYDIVFFETSYFSRVDNTTTELYRDYLIVPSSYPDITIYSDSNFKAIIELSGTFYDTAEYVNSVLNNEYFNSFNNIQDYYYNEGYNQGYYNGSGIDPNDYIEKHNALGWIFAIFEAFAAFFALKIGPVSIGAIVIVPLAISLVWFILRMLRGGSAG